MRPEVFQTLSQIAIALGIVITAAGGWGAYYFGNKVEGAKDALAKEREDQLHAQVGQLVDGNRRLEQRLEPFEELAKKAYPSIERDAALGRLLREFEELKARASDLEQQTAPRRLDQPRQRQLSADLRSVGQATMTLTSVMGDQEARRFAEDLKVSIETAGWTVNGVNQAMYEGPVQGLILKVGADPPPPPVNVLFKAVNRLGFEVKGELDTKQAPEYFELIVGSK